MKKRIIPILGLMAISLISSSASAHAPETYQCTRAEAGVWNQEEWGQCTTDGQTPDLSAGISRDEYSNGLCFPSFNNYTDHFLSDSDGNPILGRNGQPRDIGPDGEANSFSSTLFVDERNFLQAAVLDENQEFQPYSSFGDELQIEEGDTVRFIMYIHNDGDPCFNVHKEGDPDGIFTTSLNTKASLTSDAITLRGQSDTGSTVDRFILDSSKDFVASIWSDNAVNKDNIVGGKQTDGVNIQPVNANDRLYLDFNHGTQKLVYVDKSADPGSPNDITLSQEDAQNFFEKNGMALSTFDQGAQNPADIKRNSGDYFASQPYIALLQFEMEVKKEEEAPNYCVDLDFQEPLEKLTATEAALISGSSIQTLYRLDLNSYEFTNGNTPVGALIDFSSSDPEGKFYIKAPGVPGLVDLNLFPPNQENKLTFSVFLALFANDVYYEPGNIYQSTRLAMSLQNVEVDPELDPRSCTDLVIIEPTAPVCKDLTTSPSLAITQEAKQELTGLQNVEELYLYELNIASINIAGFEAVESDLTVEFIATNSSGEFWELDENGILLPTGVARNYSITFEKFVEQGYKVFYANRNETIVVTHLDGVDDSIISGPQCFGAFNIPQIPQDEPPVCFDSRLKIFNYETGEETPTNSCIDSASYTLFADFFDTTNTAIQDFEVTWMTTDPSGQFFSSEEDLENNTNGQPGTFTTDTSTTFYNGSGDISYEITELNGLPYVAPEGCKGGINSCEVVVEPVCEDLSVNTVRLDINNLNASPTPTNVFEADNLYYINSQTTYDAPVSNEFVRYSTNQGYFITDPSPNTDVFDFIRNTLINEAVNSTNFIETEFAKQNVTVESGQLVIFVTFPDASGTDTLNITAIQNGEETGVAACETEFNIIPKAPFCEAINLSPSEDQKVGTPITFTIDPVDTEGNPLPSDIQLLWQTNAGGTLSAQSQTSRAPITSNENGVLPLSADQTTVEYTGAEFPGSLSVSFRDTNSEYLNPAVSSCSEEIQFLEDAICEDLEILDARTLQPITSFEAGERYEITAVAEYSKDPASNFITLTTTEGYFVKEDEVPRRFRPVIDSIINTTVNLGTVDNKINLNGQYTKQTITIESGEKVTFVTFKDATTNRDGLIAQAIQNGSPVAEEACRDLVPTIATPEEPNACQAIDVLISPEPFDPTQETCFLVQGQLGDFDGYFEFSASSGNFTHPDQPPSLGSQNYKLFTVEQAASGRVCYSGGEPGDNVNIRAVGDLAGDNCNAIFTSDPEEEIVCEDLYIEEPAGKWDQRDLEIGDDDEQRFKIRVRTNPPGLANTLSYKWSVNNSSGAEWRFGDNPNDDTTTTNSQNTSNPLVNYLEDIDIDERTEVEVFAVGFEDVCRDSATLDIEDEEESEIEKTVYDHRSNDWERSINIGGKRSPSRWFDSEDQYITYRVIFETGSAESASIYESSFDNGSIEAENTRDGDFDYEGLAIAVQEDNGDYTLLYRSEDFDEDHYDNENIYGSQDITDFDDDNFDDDEEHYFCDNDDSRRSNNEICIENDIDDIEDDFSDNQEIQFKNTDQVRRIFIIYQAENNTAVDEDYCENLDPEEDGCGEEFENTVRFTAYTDDDFDDELETGRDDARVIVVCPFILTREGGDTFFYSAISAGIDVSQCTEVKTSKPPVIIPTPPSDPNVPNTGGTEDNSTDELVLTNPSNDICKISNSDDVEVENYRNVLENFSSAVCEVQATVSEIWTEQNIVNAINNNITKIARFGSINRDITIVSTDSVEREFSNSNLSSGVFVVEGDLTIGSARTGFTVKGTNAIPAAQTYIIRGGELNILNDIKYDNSGTSVNFTRPNTIPSVAFIVIDGNINISNNVKQLDGIYMAVDTNSSGDGTINSLQNTPEYQNTLRINGSLIGDVINIFTNRRAIGNILSDDGSITIKYDQRILLNTPPGLGELIDVTQLRIVN